MIRVNNWGANRANTQRQSVSENWTSSWPPYAHLICVFQIGKYHNTLEWRRRWIALYERIYVRCILFGFSVSLEKKKIGVTADRHFFFNIAILSDAKTESNNFEFRAVTFYERDIFDDDQWSSKKRTNFFFFFKESFFFFSQIKSAIWLWDMYSVAKPHFPKNLRFLPFQMVNTPIYNP